VLTGEEGPELRYETQGGFIAHKGEGKTALGLPMIPRFIYRTGKTSYSATLATRENFKTVEAFWHNHKTGERQKATEGEGAPIKRLRHNYPNEKEAKQAAKA